MTIPATERFTLAGLDDDDVLDVEEVALALRLSTDKAWQMARTKTLKSVRAGRSVRFRVGDLRQFIRDGGDQ